MKRIASLFAATVALGSFSTAYAQDVGLPHTFSSGTPALASEVNENFRYVAPRNVVFVHPVEGGTATDNGDRLVAALDPDNLASINGAPSSENQYLIRLSPGTFDLGTQTLVMQSYVHLEGAGKEATLITSAVSEASEDAGTLRLADHSAVRHLTVANTGATSRLAVSCPGTVSASLEDVQVNAWNGASSATIGMWCTGAVNVRLRDVSMSVIGSTSTVHAIELSSSGYLTLERTSIEVAGLGGQARGLVLGTASGSIDAEVIDSSISAQTTTKTAGTQSYVFEVGANVDLRVRGGTYLADQAETNAPVYLRSASSAVELHHCIAVANGDDLGETHLLGELEGGTLKVGASQIQTGGWRGTGTVTCVFTYDAAFEAAVCSGLI